MADGAAPTGTPSRSTVHASRELMAHLRIAARRVELSHHDAAEDDQRPLTLLVRQPSPELVERRRPNDRRARGGATIAGPGDAGLLLGSLGVERRSSTPAGEWQPE